MERGLGGSESHSSGQMLSQRQTGICMYSPQTPEEAQLSQQLLFSHVCLSDQHLPGASLMWSVSSSRCSASGELCDLGYPGFLIKSNEDDNPNITGSCGGWRPAQSPNSVEPGWEEGTFGILLG